MLTVQNIQFDGKLFSDETLRPIKLAQAFPTIETLKQTFYGIPFEDIPICYMKCSKNNTLITIADAKGKPILYTSCSVEGFKNSVKAMRRGIKTVRIMVKGLGPGRMSAIKGMATGGLNIVSITDNTILPELGPRPRKERKV
ncbi:unnamed protein product [Soboliphyme baturini]|uniref:30S ribosomal protein S11 n=1 Tax=Soboliphyme baturini TaxID=241478 RepID=A0A183IQ71_9BILA|nr:unnamed protein product [Soboliphyme baturini]